MIERRHIDELEMRPGLADFRKHLRITSTDLDADLRSKLLAGLESAEHEISTVIAPSEFTLTGPFSPTIPLRWPVTSVTSVAVDGVPITSYTFGESSLSFSEGVSGARVEVKYKAGLPDVPEDIRNAILLLAGYLFNNITDRPEERDRTAARNMLRPYRRWEGEGDGR